jgi:hypothetical protein
MLSYTGKRGLIFLILSYLILAIIGSFSFSIGSDYFYFYYNNNNNLFGTNIYTFSKNNTVDWEAEDTNTIIKTNRARNSHFRNAIIRVLTIAGIIITAVYFSKSYFRILKDNYIPITKNQILLKLRI